MHHCTVARVLLWCPGWWLSGCLFFLLLAFPSLMVLCQCYVDGKSRESLRFVFGLDGAWGNFLMFAYRYVLESLKTCCVFKSTEYEGFGSKTFRHKTKRDWLVYLSVIWTLGRASAKEVWLCQFTPGYGKFINILVLKSQDDTWWRRVYYWTEVCGNICWRNGLDLWPPCSFVFVFIMDSPTSLCHFWSRLCLKLSTDVNRNWRKFTFKQMQE